MDYHEISHNKSISEWLYFIHNHISPRNLARISCSFVEDIDDIDFPLHSFSSIPPVYSLILDMVKFYFKPFRENNLYQTGLCCRAKDACKEAECLISLMYWANELYFSQSCKNVSITRTVGSNELEKSFFRGERHQLLFQIITSILKAWGSKIWRLVAASLVLNMFSMWTESLHSCFSDSRKLPSTEAQAELKLWHSNYLETWEIKLPTFLNTVVFLLVIFTLLFFRHKEKEISFIWDAFHARFLSII